MKIVPSLLVIAALAASWATVASPAENKTGKDELLTLYLLSVAADRCGFAISAKQADMIDREAKALVAKLRLGARENNAIYSKADIAFERQGPAACDRNGAFAQRFRQTLQSLTGP
ncbi:MAG TPA: hypothetical protein VHK44_09805 [Xanthobacteraceae bacterium]|jgi:hypothetical protein|nr:hypothetical protein [Xanthobacteraceae bacterium]